MALHDTLNRPLRSLRVSVTDRCNIRCEYCMPEAEYVWLPREDILTFEEIGRLVEIFGGDGVNRVRLTGGEPLLRRALPELIGSLAAQPQVEDLALTTNGVLLEAQAASLRQAGLHRITVSLDTLQPDRFKTLTRFDHHARVLGGLEAAVACKFDSVKLDTVVIRGFNDDELIPLLEYGRRLGVEVRFIEYMDVGGATRWSSEAVVTRREMIAALAAHYGRIDPVDECTTAPADRYILPDGTVFGVISSTTEPFCHACDRSRLTADGTWYLCLYAQQGLGLRGPLRAGASPAQMRELIRAAWTTRTDRGAEERLSTKQRAALLEVTRLREDSRLEMHTRGG